jgi:undecaprenyl-diphosphatase
VRRPVHLENTVLNLLQALILGIIQGLTEFIPVSSTAHLLIMQQLLGLPSGDRMFAYLVIVQLGTVLSLIVLFWSDLLKLAQAFVARPWSTPDNRLAWSIVIATIPAALLGFFLRDAVEAMFQRPLLEAAIRLLSAAILLTLAEWLGRKSRRLENLTALDAFVIGCFQVIAVFPGASRSGTTIAGGMLRGLDRPSAARFAFLMAAPIMLGDGAYQVLDVLRLPGLGEFALAIAVGFGAAAAFGWLSVRWLIGYLSSRSLYLFAGYCGVLGLVVLIFGLI